MKAFVFPVFIVSRFFFSTRRVILPNMTLERLERMTYAPVKKHAFRRRVTSARKFYSVRKDIFADYSEKVAGGQPEKTEISALDVRALGSPQLKKQCALRRSLFLANRQTSMLRKLACKEYANKKVIKVVTVVDFFANVCSYKPTMRGLQIRTLDKSQAKRCEQYASFVYNLNVQHFVKR